ncbi:cell death (apoptosis) [Rhizoctonia solani]|uniref:Cell death (Apoptosis) n=1 Tax=Rhizoctonia solani TaxID=456999 RepID=A0A8H7IHD9_9AGAM|nr:cell death (apoptosis) [Rhizoctonia solani]
MGKSNNSQTIHSAVAVEPFAGSPHHTLSFFYKAVYPSPTQSDYSLPTCFPSSPTSHEYFDAVDDWSADTNDEDDLFYDAYEGPLEHSSPECTDMETCAYELQYEGAAKGAIGGRKPRVGPPRSTMGTASASASAYLPLCSRAPLDPLTFTSSRGPSKPTSGPETKTSATSLAAEQAQRAVPPPVRAPLKKALVVGFNYTKSGFSEDKHLKYAVRDAELWRKTLMDKGVLDENITIFTDINPELATYHHLLHSIRCLVHDVRAGDTLFFVYSGHAILSQEYGPSILTADRMIFPRYILEQELVMSIPAGADLKVVFDCCHSAGMIGLQYCVGRMAPPPLLPRAEELAAHTAQCAKPQGTSQPTEVAPPHTSQPFSHAPQHGSLYGISTAGDVTAPRRPPVTPAMVDLNTSCRRHRRREPTWNRGRCGQALGLVYWAWFITYPKRDSTCLNSNRNSGQVQTSAPAEVAFQASSAPARPSIPRRACQGVVEGDRMPDYFEERKDGFVRPAGKVASLVFCMVWAATGKNQKAFEAYGRAKQGIVTKAMCDALAACADGVSTCREVWSYLVQEIDCENNHRSKRDASKGNAPAFGRIQHAELWVSQGDPDVPLCSAGPILDQPML